MKAIDFIESIGELVCVPIWLLTEWIEDHFFPPKKEINE